MPSALFPLGIISVTPCAYSLLEGQKLNWLAFVHRHQCGDWGNQDDAAKQANQVAISNGNKILSVYDLEPVTDDKRQDQLWVLTEADRTCTTILLPEEY